MTKQKKLRELLAADEVIMAPGVYDALSAKLVEYAGFPMCATTGFGLHSALLGVPDFGLLSFSEVLSTISNIVDAVNIPVTADGESGYGNALNTIRTVRTFEQSGLAGLFIEDQKLPPNCPYIGKVELISIDEMVGKIHAALDTRKDKDFVIIARSDAPYEEGVERAQAYIEAGADMIMLIPKSRKEIESIPKKVNAPLRLAYSPGTEEFSGLTAWDLGSIGYKMISFPISPLFANAKAVLKMLLEIKEKGTDEKMLDEMMPYEKFIQLVGADDFRKAQEKYVRK